MTRFEKQVVTLLSLSLFDSLSQDFFLFSLQRYMYSLYDLISYIP